ncbi:MAG TPA: TolC family protein [Bacteroidia bacterium]|nr:TolC family protein [Bacteroidia bacterium]
MCGIRSDAQQEKTAPIPDVFSLNDVIALATGQSPASKLASTNYLTKYWQFRLYESNYLPQVALNATLPYLNRAINPIIQPDGTSKFLPQSLLTNSLGVNLTQNIGLTNSQIFVSSQVQRVDILSSPMSSSYLVNPVIFGINQPVFGFNKLRWDTRIEPLKFDEAKKQFNEDMEQLAIQASELFFDLLTAQMQVTIQHKNVSNSDTLYHISEGRYNLGKIAENDLLQMELNVMRARSAEAQAELDADLSNLKLANFLKLPSDQVMKLIPPNLLPNFQVDAKKALEEAQKNSQAITAFRRRNLEAERDVTKAIRDNRFSANIMASYGLSNSGPMLENQFTNASDQQQIRIALQVPIMDWGKAKSQIRTAEALMEYTQISVEQEEQSMHQEILMLSKQFEMHRQKLLIAQKADTIAQKRFEITMKRYIIGKIGITDLNIAQQEKDQARLDYIRDLRDFWHTYFDIRKRTLYDFQTDKAIEHAH